MRRVFVIAAILLGLSSLARADQFQYAPISTAGCTAVANNFISALSYGSGCTQLQPSAANLSDGTTGSGLVVLGTSPTLTGTPAIGAATGTSLSVTGQLTSTVATGTAPLVVSSTTNVANLNAATLNGTTFASPAAIGTGTPAAGTFTALTSTSGSITGLTGLAIRDTSAAFDVTLAATSSPILSLGRTLTLNMNNVAHTLNFNGTANTITFPNTASYTLVGSLDTTLPAAIVASSLTSTGALTGGSIASGFGTIATANTITTTNATASTSPTTGAVIVTGGIGTGNDLHAGGVVQASNYLQSGANGIFINGATSGNVQFKVAAVASGILTFPAGTIDFSATGGAGQVVQQLSAGGAFTVSTLANANLSAGTYSNITGTGALAAGSIASGFGSILTTNSITGGTFIPTSATPPSNGLYLRAAATPNIAANSQAVMDFTSSGTVANFLVLQSRATGTAVQLYASSDAGLSFGIGNNTTGINFNSNMAGTPVTMFQLLPVALATNNITIAPSAGGNPTINTTGGSLAITPATVFASSYQSAGSTVAGLPAAGTAGRRRHVTDQLTTCPVPGAALTGGGAKTCPVFDDGTAWVGG